MGKKYIIELESGTHIFVLGPEGIVHIGEPDVVYETVDGMQIGDAVINAKPYTDPDLEQIRKEAYENGRKDGKIEGQAETWVCVKKIALHPEEGGIALGDIRKIFGCSHFQTVFRDYSASEAIEKIRQYEQEQKKLKVGDEVITDFGKAAVIGVGPVHFAYVYADGCGDDKVKNAKKTGRHFPEIAEVLAKMKENK